MASKRRSVRNTGRWYYTFIGTEPFTRSGQLRYEIDDDTTVIQADLDGNGMANIELLLTGSLVMQVTDFIFA